MFGIDDALLGAAVGGVTGLASTWWTNEKAAERQSDAQGFSAQQYATRYQTQVKDLQAAGLNPMLAYAQSPGSAPQGVAAPVQNPADSMSKLTGALLQAVLNSAQVANVQADTENKKATQDLIDAQTGATRASAAQSEAQARVLDQTVDKIKAEVENTQTDTERLKRAVELVYQQTQTARSQEILNTQNTLYTDYNIDYLKALVSKVVSETKLNQLDIDAAEKFNNMGREVKEWSPIIEIFKNVMRSTRR